MMDSLSDVRQESVEFVRWFLEEGRIAMLTRRSLMKAGAACAGVSSIGLRWCAAQKTSATSRLPRENLMVYRDQSGALHDVTTSDGWMMRRREIVAGMESVMGKLPGDEKRCPLDVQVEEEFDGGSYVRRLITYASEPNGRVPAYLLIPKNALEGKAKVPAALCLHGTNNVVGHGVVVGLGETPNRSYALELAQRGYVTLAPNYPLLAKYQPDVAKLGWESGTLKAVWDNIRGLDLLETLDYVDRERGFGTIGHSLGGHNSVYTAVFDERLKVVVTSCGLDSYLDYYQGNEANWFPQKGWCQTRYMLKLADYRGRLAEIPFDFHEMIGAIAPRKVLIVAPLRDSNFRHESVDRVVRAARPVYALLGQPGNLQVEHPDCEHDFPNEMRQLAYSIMDKTLKRL
ncbi:MAG: alpha/beta hydrolase [Pirellula sp.]